MGSGFRVQRYEEKMRNSEKIREKLRIICKFLCISVIFICKFMCISVRIICKFLGISVRIICKSLLISVKIVSFFCSNAPTPQGSFYLFTFLPFYLSMSLPEKQKLLPLHYEITRKRTLGNRKKTSENHHKMIER